jgi:hypothetical protein
MKAKKVVTVALLLLVAASVAAMVVNRLRGGSGDPGGQNQVIAYYFHGKARCPTCESIQAQAEEAVKTGFPEQLDKGQLEWRVVDYSAPGNEHLRKDYNLVAATVYLVKFTDGKPTDNENLARVWELVDDKEAFAAYVQEQLKAFLEGSKTQSDES